MDNVITSISCWNSFLLSPNTPCYQLYGVLLDDKDGDRGSSGRIFNLSRWILLAFVGISFIFILLGYGASFEHLLYNTWFQYHLHSFESHQMEVLHLPGALQGKKRLQLQETGGKG